MRHDDPSPPSNTRKFFDPVKLRDWVKENAKEAFQTSLNKLETDKFRLRVKDVHFDPAKEHFSLKEQKQAILHKEDVTTPLKGTFELVDKASGKVVDQKKTTIASIPFITERNTAILNGSEYIVVNQQRLKPGVYSRVRESGESEGHVNVAPGTGLSGKLLFEPDKALFVYILGTTRIKLYGLLHDLGVSDSEMEKAWGKEILLRNKMQHEGNEIEKFYHKIFERR